MHKWSLVIISTYLKHVTVFFVGMMSTAASLGLVLLWDVDGGLTQIDKYLYSSEDYIKVLLKQNLWNTAEGGKNVNFP